MFAYRIARRLRHRRRSLEARLGLDTLSAPDDMVGHLCRWGVGMPWVVGVTSPEQGEFSHRFLVDCPLLHCREPWFAVKDLGAAPEDGPEVVVVLPSSVAHQGVAVGWADRADGIDSCCSLTAVALPATPQELSALQQLLLVAYSAAFDRAG